MRLYTANKTIKMFCDKIHVKRLEHNNIKNRNEVENEGKTALELHRLCVVIWWWWSHVIVRKQLNSTTYNNYN